MDFAYKTYFTVGAQHRLRNADLRLHDRRRDAVPARRQRRGRLAGGAADPRRLGEQSAPRLSRTMPRAATVPRRPTSCWRATAAPGGRSNERSRRGPDGREAQDFPGAGGRGRHARHRGEDPDQARAGRRAKPARRRHPLRHHQRPAAAGHGHAVRRARARDADRRLQRRAFRQAGPHDPRAEDGAGRCRRRSDRADSRARPRCLGL